MASAAVLGGRKWVKVLERLAAEKKSLSVGIMAGKTNKETGEPIAPYAFYNEYGTDRIPARSFMRSTIQEKEGQWVTGVSRLLSGNIGEPGVVEHALNALGRQMQGDIQAKIASNMPPPNAPKTIAKKGPGKNTLIDTSSMINAIEYEVK